MSFAGLATALAAPAATRAPFTEQAQVTNWPLRLALIAVVVAVIALAVWGMAVSWSRRGRSQQAIAGAGLPPVRPVGEWLAPVPGRYLATTRTPDWLDRVVVHGLGVPSNASVSVGSAGVLIERQGANDVFIPAEDLAGVRLDRGIAGAVYEQGGVVLFTWKLGDTLLDSGFRARRIDDHVAVVEAVQRLLPPGNSA